MDIPVVAVGAFLAEGVSAVVGLAMLLLVLWQAPRHWDNRLMALFMATVVLWAGSASSARFVLLLGGDGEVFLHTAALAVGLAGPALFLLVTHYADLWGRVWVRAALIASAPLLLAAAPLIYTGRILRLITLETGELIGYEVLPLGYLAFALAFGHYLASVAILWPRRCERAGALWTGAVLVCAGALKSGMPFLTAVPLDVMLVAAGSVSFARAILREKLFNPLAVAQPGRRAVHPKRSGFPGGLGPAGGHRHRERAAV